MDTFTLSEWTDFMIAAAGAAAGLAGLFVVAISVNIDVLVQYRSLPARGPPPSPR